MPAYALSISPTVGDHPVYPPEWVFQSFVTWKSDESPAAAHDVSIMTHSDTLCTLSYFVYIYNGPPDGFNLRVSRMLIYKSVHRVRNHL